MLSRRASIVSVAGESLSVNGNSKAEARVSSNLEGCKVGLVSTQSDPDDFIPLREGARMLGLDVSTIRKRKAGTDQLTIIAQGRKLFLLRGEVIAHRRKMIEDARQRNDVLRLVRK